MALMRMQNSTQIAFWSFLREGDMIKKVDIDDDEPLKNEEIEAILRVKRAKWVRGTETQRDVTGIAKK